MEVQNLQILEEVMEKREEARLKYKNFVFNKMKPNWLYAQVASHPFSKYWVIWIDENITTAISKSNISKLCTAGFDLYPFQNWAQSQEYIEKCGSKVFEEK